MMRVLGSSAVFIVSLLAMIVASTVAWALINGKLYYCTNGGTLDFIFVGDWVHHPESVAHIVPRSMGEPDEIKAGWSIAGLWFLLILFAAVSVFVSALFARMLWCATRAKIGHEDTHAV
jgi:hypothetical protein